MRVVLHITLGEMDSEAEVVRVAELPLRRLGCVDGLRFEVVGSKVAGW